MANTIIHPVRRCVVWPHVTCQAGCVTLTWVAWLKMTGHPAGWQTNHWTAPGALASNYRACDIKRKQKKKKKSRQNEGTDKTKRRRNKNKDHWSPFLWQTTVFVSPLARTADREQRYWRRISARQLGRRGFQTQQIESHLPGGERARGDCGSTIDETEHSRWRASWCPCREKPSPLNRCVFMTPDASLKLENLTAFISYITRSQPVETGHTSCGQSATVHGADSWQTYGWISTRQTSCLEQKLA